MQNFDAIVIGAGAAGLFCAGIAGQRGLRVLVLDHSEKVAEKIRISGGGRANFTNRDLDPHAPHKHFISANPDFCRSALSRYTPADFIALVQTPRHRLPRKAQGPAVLRPLGRRPDPDAAARVRGRRRAALAALRREGGAPWTATALYALDTDRGTVRSRARGGGHRRPVDPQDRRHRLRLPASPSSSACAWSNRARAWCR